MFAALLLPIADFKTVKAPTPREMPSAAGGLLSDSVLGAAIILGLFALLWLLVTLRSGRKSGAAIPAGRAASWILVDGSNVMHWQDNLPRLDPLIRVVENLKRLGYAPGVVFDANAGWKLFGRYVNESEMAHLLGLPSEQVLVAPKGTPADPYLLMTALDFKARIVTNDRYRDWAEEYPEVQEKGFLVRGGLRDGTVWLNGLEPVANDKA